jgi:hypothetical protein
MATALSPTTNAAAKDAAPATAKEFAELVKYYQQTHKAIVRLTALVRGVPANQALKIGGHTIRRSDISKYSQAYVAQLGDLRKLYANRKRKTNRSNAQLNQLFYVSDQLVKFYTGAKLGPSDPENPRGRKLNAEIDLLTKRHMSTSGILTSLISRYIETNELKTSGQPRRFKPDAKMKDCLSSTTYMLFDEDLSDREIPPSTRPEKADKIRDNISLGKKSAFARVNGRMDKRSGEAFFNPKTGLLYTTMMVFNNYYRIPNELLSEEERSALTDSDNVDDAKQLQETLTNITKSKK